jgi:hypothetical protein
MFAAARTRNIDLRPTARTDIALRGWAGRTRRRLRIPRRTSERSYEPSLLCICKLSK